MQCKVCGKAFDISKKLEKFDGDTNFWKILKKIFPPKGNAICDKCKKLNSNKARNK